MISRREYLRLCIAAGVTLTLSPSLLRATDRVMPLITRQIPSSGRYVPVVGLGSSATFANVARSEDHDSLRGVFAALVANGGSVFDTAPAYGASEEVAGAIARELDITEKIFWATKVNVAGFRGGSADPEAARAQIETSFKRIGKPVIDLIQVHNLADMSTQFGILKEYKAQERVQHIGVTTTFPGQYGELEQVMQRDSLDFIGIDYAIDNRVMEERILPLAQEKGIAVLVYVPFGRTRLWDKVRGKPVPEWAAEFDATSWAQFFLKFVIAHPAVTSVTPATSKPKHMVDNMGAAYGRLPDEAMRRRMIEYIEVV